MRVQDGEDAPLARSLAVVFGVAVPQIGTNVGLLLRHLEWPIWKYEKASPR